MAQSVEIVAQERKDHGTRAARRLRRGGQVPGVVYGHQEATVPIAVRGDELSRAIRHGARIIDLKQGEAVQRALIKELQWDPLGHDILHVDFTRISKDEKLELPVRIELRGTSPGVTAGGILSQVLHELTIECLPDSIPNSIRVNIGAMQIGDVLHIRELTLPPGVTVKADPEAVVVQIAAPIVEAEPAAAAVAAGESAEPEVIGRVKTEEEEGEAK
jgi:large subunit ribosomal protein L25